MKTITPEILRLYRRLRADSPSMLVGRCAETCLRDARTIARFRELESDGLVRMRTEPETESYFDVYGREESEAQQKRTEEIIERWGCWCVCAEFLAEDEPRIPPL